MGLDGAAVGVGREGERDMEWCSSEGGRVMLYRFVIEWRNHL